MKYFLDSQGYSFKELTEETFQKTFLKHAEEGVNYLLKIQKIKEDDLLVLIGIVKFSSSANDFYFKRLNGTPISISVYDNCGEPGRCVSVSSDVNILRKIEND